jgi:hypothetical protein
MSHLPGKHYGSKDFFRSKQGWGVRLLDDGQVCDEQCGWFDGQLSDKKVVWRGDLPAHPQLPGWRMHT